MGDRMTMIQFLLNDKAHLQGTEESIELKDDSWLFDIKGIRTKNLLYLLQETGLRAKNLLGQDGNFFVSEATISYAITDFMAPFSKCKELLEERFPELDGSQPEAIIIEKNDCHCAIADNEDSKFVQSNPKKGVITQDSISMINTYFPSGVKYKGYPKTSSDFTTNNLFIH